MIRPKVTHSGSLFDGLVDVYVLDNGLRILSQRGAIRGLTGSGAGSANLDRFIERLPSRFGRLEVVPVLEFRGLTGSATGFAPFGRFIERLPNRFAHLKAQPVLEFRGQNGELPGTSPRPTVGRGKLRGKTHEITVNAKGGAA